MVAVENRGVDSHRPPNKRDPDTIPTSPRSTGGSSRILCFVNFASIRLSDIFSGNRHGRISAQYGLLMSYLNSGALPDGVAALDLLDRYLAARASLRDRGVLSPILDRSATIGEAAAALADALGINVDAYRQDKINRERAAGRQLRIASLARDAAQREAAKLLEEANAVRIKADRLQRLANDRREAQL